MTEQGFSPDFIWSVATSAFQIEGARREDGRARSIWDDFVERPGAVRDNTTADLGPDSYHRYLEDIALLKELGVDEYRFSLSWVRIQREAGGEINQRGLDYYGRVIDALLESGIRPVPTLYHWDLHSTWEARGGWLARESVEHFADYAAIVAGAFSDRVDAWYTVNEPASTSLQGYALGELAPGLQLLWGALPTIHHQLLAHGHATRILREHGAARVGCVHNHSLILPESESEEDATAAVFADAVVNRVFADPVILGRYPDSGGLDEMMPIHDGDMEVIATPVDVYGFNFYNPMTVRAASGDLPFDMVPTPGASHTGFGELWPIMPSALRDCLVDFRTRYGDALPPLLIAENGASFPEPDVVSAPIDDQNRIEYLAGHLRAIGEAIDRGVDVRGYTVWSLLDNFEWAEGYTQRFGIVHVEQESGTRTPKASFEWYRDVISAAKEANDR